MGIALSAAHGLFTPLQDLLTWLLSPVQSRQLPSRTSPSRPLPSCVRPAGPASRAAPRVRPQPMHTGARRSPVDSAQTRRPLRVVRVMDRDVAGTRMVISGRLADVCAELDRLAALEQAHS